MAAARALILAGGSGTRLWPRSTDERPKPFLPLTSDRSLLRETFDRAAALAGPGNVVLSARASHAALVTRELPELSPARLVLEPSRRNTAPAIALAALTIAEEAPDATLFVLPSDQAVRDEEAFRGALREAAGAAEAKDVFVTIGVTPTRPETGFGYLEVAAGTGFGRAARPVVRFIEKPPLAEAERYARSGRHFWNAGIFVFRIPVLVAAMERLCPDVLAAVRRALAARAAGDAAGFEAAFGKAPSISIDYAVMEKAGTVETVPCDCGWSDVGSWEAVHEFRPRDARGNAAEGDVTFVDAAENLVLADAGRKVAVIGVSGLVVVESPDGLLVSRRDAADALRGFVESAMRKGSAP